MFHSDGECLLTSEQDTPVLELRELSIRFGGQSVDLIDKVSLRIGQGRTMALVGESGCGKSVTSLAVMGLLPRNSANITHGQVLFQGRDLADCTTTQLEALRGNQMAMIFQEPMTSLNPVFTIGEQVAEAVRRHRACGHDEARARALQMFDLVRIPAAAKRMDDYPHQLSGGMRQRVMIAMALANDPELLIADEPTTALDVTIQAQILDLMRDLLVETGAAMLLITHDLGVVAEIADDVAVMYAGRVVEQAAADAIFRDPQHPYTLGLMGSMPAFGGRAQGASRLMTIPGAVPMPEAMPSGCRFTTRCPFAAAACSEARPAMRLVAGAHQVACIKAPLEEFYARGAA